MMANASLFLCLPSTVLIHSLRCPIFRCLLLTIHFFLGIELVETATAEEHWKRHTIDDSSEGADGVRPGDFDGDGLQDVVTGWEESGVIRLYLHPGVDDVRKPWPHVTIAAAQSPEDAVPFDVDGDGDLDVISCHEGSLKKVMIHRFDGDATSRQELLDSSNWQSNPIASLNGQKWMFATPIELRDGRQSVVLGSKGANASLTLLLPALEHPVKIEDWHFRRLRDCGWVMSIDSMDMDGDGDNDIMFSDRRSKHRCVGWLEQPNESPETKAWKEHIAGATSFDTLFIDPRPDRILVTTRRGQFLDLRKNKDQTWSTTAHKNPIDVPFGKSIRLLTSNTMVFTANTHADSAATKQPGVWLKQGDKDWQAICPIEECKFDLIQLIDLDGDGDLDLMTCEERQLLGVVWYENPGFK